MTDYLIELHPADFFFFANDRINHPDVKDAYYTRSAYFPQQTGLLGMLRYQLLLQNGATRPGLVFIPGEHIARATNLIGSESFSAAAGQKFGVIQKISPLCLTQRGENGTRRYLHTVPMTDGHLFEKQQPAVRAISLNGQKREFLPWLTDYKVKEGLTEGLIDDKGRRFPTEDIFRETERTGIKKSQHGIPDTGAFYRQLVRGLRKGYAFAFIATLADEFKPDENTPEEKVKVKFGNATVALGAERSTFFMEVTPKPGISFADTLPEKLETAAGQVACLSDTFLPDDLPTDLFDFLVGDTVLFNNLKTSVSEANFYAKPGLNGSSRYLLRRGAVFFTARKNDLLQKLQGETPWTNIGFNHCI